MAPLTSTPNPTTMANLAPTLKPEGQSFAGDEFSNNLFSDLAPLLTLFGEQVTKQFLSMSMGWADNILIAMGPLGILTTVVSAIRVGGVKNLKSLVGRARESLAIAEQELLSSTSDDVCEMWSGTDIVRQLGKPKTRELILFKNGYTPIPRVVSLAQAIHRELMHKSDSGGLHCLTPEKLASQAPNIALNSEGSLPPKKELWFWAVVGIILQLVAVVFPALATYFWKFSKAGSDVPGYAYPCFITGTMAIVFGVILCSHVIEGVTDERTYEPKTWEVLQVTRLQLACTVSDQSFPPFLIMNPPEDRRIHISRLLGQPDRRLSRLAGFASILTIAGFICQFVGLRGLHWSATTFQLGVTLVMTGARSWVRRGLSAEVPCVQLKPMYELEMTALLLLEYPSGISSNLSRNPIPKWKIMTGRGLQLYHEPLETPTVETANDTPSFTDSILALRQDLAQIMPNTTDGDEISLVTSKLVKSMSKILDCYENAIKDRRLQVNSAFSNRQCIEWSHGVSYHQKDKWKYERVTCRWEKAMWLVNATQSRLESMQGRLESITSRFESILRFAMLASDEESSGRISMVVIGHGGLHKDIELEDWLFPAAPLYSIVSIPSHSLLEEISNKQEDSFGISTLPFPFTPINDSEYFFAHFRREPLLHKYAVEIFSGFMKSLTESVQAVGGSTEIVGTFNIRSPYRDDREASVKENSVLMLFSQALVESGLVGTIWEAKALIIPPFASQGLLPTELGDVTFDEPVRESNSRSSAQSSSTISVGSAQREAVGQSELANVSGSNKETIEDNGRSESHIESVMKHETVTDKNERINEEQDELSKDGPIVHSVHSGRSVPEGKHDSK